YAGLLQLDGMSRPLFLHAANAKDKAGELLKAAALQRCDFEVPEAAWNLSCSAHQGAGSFNIPVKSLRCSPLEFPALEGVLAALGWPSQRQRHQQQQ
ncbi:unnamed protein product, partial [Polarella glacialis]